MRVGIEHIWLYYSVSKATVFAVTSSTVFIHVHILVRRRD